MQEKNVNKLTDKKSFKLNNKKLHVLSLNKNQKGFLKIYLYRRSTVNIKYFFLQKIYFPCILIKNYIQPQINKIAIQNQRLHISKKKLILCG